MAFAHIDRKNFLATKETYINQPKDYYNISREFLNDFKNHNIEAFKMEFSFKQNRNNWKYSVLTADEPQENGLLPILFIEEDYKNFNESNKEAFLRKVDYIESRFTNPKAKAYALEIHIRENLMHAEPLLIRELML